MYYLGIDIGNSSIKVALTDSSSGAKLNTFHEPSNDLEIISFQNDCAEQDSEKWWQHLCSAIKKIISQTNIDAAKISGIGISYQTQKLVIIDREEQQLKSPALSKNLTVSKIKWIKENDQNLYKRIYKFMLPGDFIVFKLTNNISTTKDGLSELGLWNYENDEFDKGALKRYHIKKSFVPTIVGNFENQGLVTELANHETGILEGTPILFRSEKQASFALSINVFNYGEVAITGQSPASIHTITEQLKSKESLKNNHHLKEEMPISKSIIFNGGYLQYKWLKKQFRENSFEIMNRKASEVPIGAEGVTIFPFGNGAEQMLNNKDLGAIINGVNLNNHSKGHLYRATLEGIAFSFFYGIENLINDNFEVNTINAVNNVLFQSEVFVNTLTSIVGQKMETYNTDAAVGAARACSLYDGNFKKYEATVLENDHVKTFELLKNKEPYIEAYYHWKKELEVILKNHL